MKRSIMFFWSLTCAAMLCAVMCSTRAQAFTVGNLTTESMNAPVLDAAAPRFSWKLCFTDAQKEKGLRQTAYQILVTEGEETVWDSGKVASSRSVLVPYEGAELKSSRVYLWKVRVWNEKDAVSEWSEDSAWLTGILSPEEWKAKWIALPEKERPELNLDGAQWLAPKAGEKAEFQKTVTLETADPQKVSVQLAIAADQKFEIYVNGTKTFYSIGMIFNPDQMRFFDVTSFMKAGENTLSIRVTNTAGKTPKLLARLDVFPLEEEPLFRTVPGTPVQTVLTDKTWTLADSSQTLQEVGTPDAMPWGKVRRRTERTSPAFEKHFTLAHPENVVSAVLHCTGLGYYVAGINNIGLTDSLLDPAPTRYDRRVLYESYDITGTLKKENTLGFFLGHGWYDMRTVSTWNFDAAPWRDFPRLLAQLEIRYKDGTSETIASDETWDYTTSPVVYDCIRQGVIVNYNIPHKVLGKAVVTDAPKGKLTAQRCPATYLKATSSPVKMYKPAPGVFVAAFEKNQAGFVSFTPKNLLPTDRVRFRYSERIAPDGTLDRGNIEMFFHSGSPLWMCGEKGTFQTDWFSGLENDPAHISDFGGRYHPPFVYHGFQYVEIVVFRDGKPLEDADFEVYANHFSTEFPVTGTFESSNADINAFEAATIQSYESNFVNGFPTDCPHREKNGWTGDAQLAAELAQYHFENTAAYRKWLDDLSDEQQPDGNLPGIVPTGGWGYPWGNGPAWDSALVMIPWYVYCYRGDERILSENYDAMKRYADYVYSRRNAEGLVTHGLSDWCSAGTATSATPTSTGYAYLDACIVSRTAELLGKSDDARHYAEIAESLRTSFNAHLYKGEGIYDIGSQCAQSCALHQGFADVLPDAEREKVFTALTAAVEKTQNHVDVGILGTKYLFRTLSEHGRTDLALALFLNETEPTFLRMARGTEKTLWEHVDAKSSLNHIMFGDISAWFYQYLAGIRIDGGADAVVAKLPASSFAPGFRRFTISPCCALRDVRPSNLRSVSASVETPYGTIRSAWRWDDSWQTLTLNVTVPPNTSASIVLPDGTRHEAAAGEYSFTMK